MLRLGDYNTLRIVKTVDFGLYLDGGEEGEILLPQRYVTKNMHVGDEIEVFLYLDQEERPVATTERPYAKVGEFAYLQVAWVNQFGAFLKWGLMKDLFCPFREQKKRMEQDHSYIVYIKVDEDSYRLMATAKVEKYLSVPTINDLPSLQHGAEVDILVWQKTGSWIQGYHQQQVPRVDFRESDLPALTQRHEVEGLRGSCTPGWQNRHRASADRPPADARLRRGAAALSL